MSKFTKQYTTKEQSEQVLKLGIPAWTADCYYDTWDQVQWRQSYDMDHNFFDKYNEYIPCWSTGRLIEIFNACECYDGIVDLTAVPEEIIKEIDDAIMDDMFDLDELERYKDEYNRI